MTESNFTVTIQISHLKTSFDIVGALVEAGGSDTGTPPQDILVWGDTKKMGTVAAKENWVLVKTKRSNALYHFYAPVKLV
jgi:hypothetical protein